MTEDTTDLEEIGPIDYLVIELPTASMDGSAFEHLLDLVGRGLIRVLDLAFLSKAADGSVSGVSLDEVPGGVNLTFFEGASSGLLGDDDLDEAGTAIEPGTTAALLVYENVWAAPFATALRRNGAQLVASGRIPVQALLAAIDATEPVA